MRISDWSSDVCSSDLGGRTLLDHAQAALRPHCDALIVVGRGEGLADWPQPDMGPLGGVAGALRHAASEGFDQLLTAPVDCLRLPPDLRALLEPAPAFLDTQPVIGLRTEEHTSEIQSLMRNT